jgi:hypothetical protein
MRSSGNPAGEEQLVDTEAPPFNVTIAGGQGVAADHPATGIATTPMPAVDFRKSRRFIFSLRRLRLQCNLAMGTGILLP